MGRGTPEAENGAGGNKSVVWDGSEGVEVESREVPSPSPGELRMRVEASGLCGTDLHIASGEYPFASAGVTLGHEFSGIVARKLNVGRDRGPKVLRRQCRASGGASLGLDQSSCARPPHISIPSNGAARVFGSMSGGCHMILAR